MSDIVIYQSKDDTVQINVQLENETKAEFQKYQLKILSDVEKAYLDTLKQIVSKLKKK